MHRFASMFLFSVLMFVGAAASAETPQCSPSVSGTCRMANGSLAHSCSGGYYVKTGLPNPEDACNHCRWGGPESPYRANCVSGPQSAGSTGTDPAKTPVQKMPVQKK